MPENLNQKLPSEIAEFTKEQKILSPTVAISNTLEDYENKRVVFSFEIYNKNQCEISKLTSTEAKKLTKELKKISNTLKKHFRNQSTSGIACKPVGKSGNYEVLFAEVQNDTEMLEIDYSGTGRVFGHIVNNIFNIVAICKIHR